jgi:2-polyprenyl-3-methyl-5-hydroxy-6-metoxy-1,4-benzoquinol methylase
MKRVVVPELLDTDAASPQEIAASLQDLRLVNRYFGGARVITRLLRRIARKLSLRRVSILDVGGATGDIAQVAQRRLRAYGIHVEVTILDRIPSHLRAGFPGIIGDALSLPFRDNSFDVLTASLFIHHLEPPQVRSFIDEALRVCRHAVILNDLRRNLAHLLLVRAASPLFRSPVTQWDAPASVRRAYTLPELRTLLTRTNAADFEIRRHYLFRVGAVIWKRRHA